MSLSHAIKILLQIFSRLFSICRGLNYTKTTLYCTVAVTKPDGIYLADNQGFSQTAEYAHGFSTRKISNAIEKLYDFEVSNNFVSDVTDKILLQSHKQWNSRQIDEIYPVIFIDATHYFMRDNRIVKKFDICDFGDRFCRFSNFR